MTDRIPDYQSPSGAPYSGPGWQPYLSPPKKRSWFARHKVLTVLLVLGALFLLIGVIGAAAGSKPAGTKTAATGAAHASSLPSADGLQDTTPPAPPAAGHTPTVKDFTITLKIKSKDCFGDAGCNITYEPRVTIVGPAVDKSGTYQITYEVRGGNDGAAVDTVELAGGEYSPNEGIASTARQSAKLTAVITSVETA